MLYEVITGEVGCIGDNYYDAVLQAMLSVGYRIPKQNILISSGPARSKLEMLKAAKLLVANGYNVFATAGTHKFFEENGVSSTPLFWPDEDKHPSVIDYIREKKIDLVINIPKSYNFV